MKPFPVTQRVVGELSPVKLSSSGAVKLVSALVSVRTSFLPKPLPHTRLAMEARIGIEPMMQLLQSRALPLGYPATGNRRLILFRLGIKLCFATVEAPDLTAPIQSSILSRRDQDSDQHALN